MRRPVAWSRIILVLLGLIPFVFLLFFEPSQDGRGNTDALRILITVLSILAGFLMAVITMLGDPRSLFGGSWRIASAHTREIRRALNRVAILFHIYLGTISATLGAKLLGIYTQEVILVCWIERFALSLGSAALIRSFGLPIIIRRAQLDRLDEAVEERKTKTDTPHDVAISP